MPALRGNCSGDCKMRLADRDFARSRHRSCPDNLSSRRDRFVAGRVAGVGGSNVALVAASVKRRWVKFQATMHLGLLLNHY